MAWENAMLLPATAQTCRPGLHRASYVMRCAIRAWVQKWFFKRIEYISREKKITELRLRYIALHSIESILYLTWIIIRSLAIKFVGHCHLSSSTVSHAFIYTADWLLRSTATTVSSTLRYTSDAMPMWDMTVVKYRHKSWHMSMLP